MVSDHLALLRCFHHEDRAAAARCPECRRSFCHECITEHEDRVVCSGCLKGLVGATEGSSGRRWGWVVLLPAAAGLLAAWWFFFLLGRYLLSFGPTFHDGGLPPL